MNAGMHAYGQARPEPARPVCNPSSHGIKSAYSSKADLGEAVRHAAALLEALGVAAVVPEEKDPSLTEHHLDQFLGDQVGEATREEVLEALRGHILGTVVIERWPSLVRATCWLRAGQAGTSPGPAA